MNTSELLNLTHADYGRRAAENNQAAANGLPFDKRNFLCGLGALAFSFAFTPVMPWNEKWKVEIIGSAEETKTGYLLRGWVFSKGSDYRSVSILWVSAKARTCGYTGEQLNGIANDQDVCP